MGKVGDRTPRNDSINIGLRPGERDVIEQIVNQIQENEDSKYTLTQFIREAIQEKIDRVTQLQCPKCKKLNDRFAKYCDQCGEPLTDEKRKVRKELDALVKDHPDILLKVLEEMNNK